MSAVDTRRPRRATPVAWAGFAFILAGAYVVGQNIGPGSELVSYPAALVLIALAVWFAVTTGWVRR